MTWWQVTLIVLAAVVGTGLSFAVLFMADRVWPGLICLLLTVSVLSGLVWVTTSAKQDEYARVCRDLGGIVVATSKLGRTCIESRVIPIDGKKGWTL